MPRTRGGGGVWFSRKTIDCCQTEGCQAAHFQWVKQPVEQIPSNDLPIYVLVNDVSSVSSTVDGFNRAAKDVAGLVWVTSNPGLAAYAVKKYSGTRSIEVPSLNADEILNKISTDSG